MPDNGDSIGPIPPIIPARDEVVARQPPPGRSRRQGDSGGTAAAGTPWWLLSLLVLSLLLAAAACAWAWQLQGQLQGRQVSVGADLEHQEQRIADLEERLSDTDEGVNQSAAAMGVKIKELYSEVDKLWASAWRTNKAKIAALEKADGATRDQLARLAKTDSSYSTQLKALGAEMKDLQVLADAAERLQQANRSSEAQLEKLGDDLSLLQLEYARLRKRVATNEEWVESNNAFRKQVNRSLQEINTRQGRVAESSN